MARRAHDRDSSRPKAASAGDAASDPPERGDPAAVDPVPAPDPVAPDAPVVDAEDALAAAVTIESLQRQLDEACDRSLRAQAELENFRKRTLRNMEEERRFAALPLIEDLLPVVDNLQRATAAAEEHDASAGLQAGVQLVTTQLLAVLERHHCTPIPAAPGTLFDPHLHEAMAQLPAADCPPGHISQVIQEGYLLHDRVVRPARVIVAAGAAAAEADRPEQAATDGSPPSSATPDPDGGS